MANVFINESTMTDIGNAIRSKTGKTDMILPQNMPNEIEGIKAEGTELVNSIINGTVTDIYIDVPMRSYAFYGCSNIKPTFGDKCTQISYCAFVYCGSITEINTNKVTGIESYAFDGVKNLTKADLPNVISISNYVFSGCLKLDILILRSNRICTLSGTKAFYNTPIEKGTGYIYVPKNLTEQYKVATNWVTFANQFRAIEDYPEITGGN